MTQVVHTVADLHAAYGALSRHPVGSERARTLRAVVMTMGALHDGHAALMEAARHLSGPEGIVVVTIFVNPRQFLPGEDFERYPRRLEADLEVCRAHGVDLVFAPAVDEVYDGDVPVIEAGDLGTVLEGVIRPGHFDGVLTVVHRLLRIVDPGIAVFGEKDYQQLVLVRRMARERELPVTIVGVPTVREPDGLALSSRNAYLDHEQREQARVLSLALESGRRSAHQGVDAILVSASATFAAYGVEPDYVEVTDVDLGPAPRIGEGRLLVAARIGSTRLIDNCEVQIGAGEAR